MEGKVVAITGGASGIGLATAKLLAKRGAKISIADVSEPNLEKAKEEIKKASSTSEEVLACKVDVRGLSEVQDWIKQTVDRFGKLDGGVNLAGTIGSNYGTFTVEDEDEDNWNLIIGVNLTGVMHSMKAELKHMQSGASIVNASSVAGLKGINRISAYCASKHGVIGLTRVAAKDYGPKNIRVNAIAPGFIDTPMTQKAGSVVGRERFDAGAAVAPLGRKAEAVEVANLIAFLLSDDASFITGAVYEVDAGMTC